MYRRENYSFSDFIETVLYKRYPLFMVNLIAAIVTLSFVNNFYFGFWLFLQSVSLTYCVNTYASGYNPGDLPWNSRWPFVFVLLTLPFSLVVIRSYLAILDKELDLPAPRPTPTRDVGPTPTPRFERRSERIERALSGGEVAMLNPERPEEQPTIIAQLDRDLTRAIDAIRDSYRSERPPELDYIWERAKQTVLVSAILQDSRDSIQIKENTALGRVFDLFASLRTGWSGEAVPKYRGTVEDRLAEIAEQLASAKVKHTAVRDALKKASLALSGYENSFDTYEDGQKAAQLQLKISDSRQAMRDFSHMISGLQDERSQLTSEIEGLDSGDSSEEELVAKMTQKALLQEFLSLLHIDGVYAVGIGHDNSFEVRIRKSRVYDGVEYDFGDWAIRFGNPKWPYPKIRNLRSSMLYGVTHPHHHYDSGSDFCIGSANAKMRYHTISGHIVPAVALYSAVLASTGYHNRRDSIQHKFERFNPGMEYVNDR